ncbi:hypothetical protein C9I86_00520 [Photobacterium sp. NCIMB 13483]|uniref:hypothetical protein n=1 Tax=Photobacterium sp. NCIMB 13483 TaxID=2022103 RepID=UPI000D1793D9|nr:hypothetical protein [Photobacterium sp. NCIMB 13483]PST94785.1 hypothetical protein C9I86_00520 [Photobacterium sp. NCIMB 13483]
MSRDLIQAVINLVPELADFGIGIYVNGHGLDQMQKKAEFGKNQLELLDSTESFKKTAVWLKQVEKIKSFNLRRTSYGLKSLAEKDIGYITNGVFIAPLCISDAHCAPEIS